MIGEKLRDARKAKGYTQNELANLMGVKNNTISDWERGITEPDIDQINQLCSFLDVEPNWLFNHSSAAPLNIETLKFLQNHNFEELPAEAKKEIDLMVDFIKVKYKK